MTQQSTTRLLSTIAREIISDWTKPSPYAKPYISAMAELASIEDKYYYDDARSVVLYFLANAQSWRGECARRIKQELKEMLDARARAQQKGN